MMRSSQRIANVQLPVVPHVGELVRSTPGAISLAQGVVGYGPPREALDAVAAFGETVHDHHYGPDEGLPDLIEVIRHKLRTENGIPLDGRAIMVTAGGNMAFLTAVLAITDPEDEIILPLPYYFNHDMAIAIAGCRTVPVSTSAAYQPLPELIRAAMTPRTRAVVTISPNNPTGAVYPRATLCAINQLCRDAGVYHIHDEVYEYFTYDGVAHYSPAADPASQPHTIALYSMSKAYGLASWRVGWMVVPEALYAPVTKVQDTNVICPPSISQRAACAALEVGRSYCDARVAALGDLRHRALDAFAEMQDVCTVPPVSGAFYLLLRIHGTVDPLLLVERLIREHGVALLPGSAFGLTDGCYLRLSYGAVPADRLGEGLERLARGLRAILRGT
ncbi:MAG: pyridoxal phosphate-dependent aminotransferase [Luteitalea sp.]|nr:pyridoxal phosphate-dependent aminotransferase [Luteitalea sp.]